MDIYDFKGFSIPVTRKRQLDLYTHFSMYLIIQTTLQGYYVEKSRLTRSKELLKSEEEVIELLSYYQENGIDKHRMLLHLV